MRANFLVQIALACLCLLTCKSSQTKSSKYQKLGIEVCRILQQLETQALSDLLDGYISVDEIQRLSLNDTLVTEERTRGQMQLVTQEQWKQKKAKELNRLYKSGKDFGIEWKNINFLSIESHTEIDKGLQSLRSTVRFTAGEKEYFVQTIHIFDGKHYRLVEVRYR